MIDRMPPGFTPPPHNIEAEQALLGAVMLNNLGYHQAVNLRPDHFYEPVHSRIWMAMQRLVGSGRLADHVTLKAEFDADEALRELDGAHYLAGLARAAETILNVRDYAEHIVELAGRRRMQEIMRDALAIAGDTAVPMSLDELASRAMADLSDITSEHAARAPWVHVSQVLERIASRLERPIEAMPTGLPTLDRALGGGLRCGQLYALEAPPKAGKTMLLGTMALALLRQGCPTLYLALEMGSERITERMIGAATECSASRFRAGTDPEDLQSRVMTFGHRHGHAPLWYADEPGLSLDRLRAMASAAPNRIGARALLVDYWQLVTGVRRGQTKADHLTEVADWLAAYAQREDMCVVVTSQTNRQGLGLQGDGLDRAADWLAQLHCDDNGGMWMDVRRNRDGPAGAVGSEDRPAWRIAAHAGPVVVEA